MIRSCKHLSLPFIAYLIVLSVLLSLWELISKLLELRTDCKLWNQALMLQYERHMHVWHACVRAYVCTHACRHACVRAFM